MLDRLGEAGLKLKAKKCQLFQEKIPFLGHIVSVGGIGPDPAKCQQVRNWPVPRDLHEVRSFVRRCSYYQRHIQGFPLYELATEGTDFERTSRRDEAFEHASHVVNELSCHKCRTVRNGSLPTSVSLWKGANNATARQERSC